MSREALAYVAEHSQTKGSKRAVMMAIASACSKRKQPFVKRISAETIASMVGLKTRQVQNIVRELDLEFELDIYAKGVGRSPNTYEIRCRSAQSDCVTTKWKRVQLPEGSYAKSLNGSRARHTAKRLCSDVPRVEPDRVEPPF